MSIYILTDSHPHECSFFSWFCYPPEEKIEAERDMLNTPWTQAILYRPLTLICSLLHSSKMRFLREIKGT